MTMYKRILLWVLKPVIADIDQAVAKAVAADLETHAADMEALRAGAGFMKVSKGSVARSSDGAVFRASA